MRSPSRTLQNSRRAALAVAALAVAASTATTGCSERPTDSGVSAEEAQIVTESAVDPDDTASATTVAPATDGSARPSMTAANAAMLDQTIALVGGGELDLAGLTDRPVLLWFWAPF